MDDYASSILLPNVGPIVFYPRRVKHNRAPRIIVYKNYSESYIILNISF